MAQNQWKFDQRDRTADADMRGTRRPFAIGRAKSRVMSRVVSLGITIFLFFNGNRVALQRRRYADPQEFRAVERAWAIAGAILFLPTLFVTLMWAVTIVAVVFAKTPA